MPKPYNFFLLAVAASAVILAPSATSAVAERSNTRETQHVSLLHPSSRRKRSRPAAFLPLFTSVLDSTGEDDSSVWYELRPPVTRYDLDPEWSSPSEKPARKLVWYGRYDEEQTWIPRPTLMNDSTGTSTTAAETFDSSENSPHPLRTSSWNLQVQWTGKWDRTLPNNLDIEFDTDTGYCRASSPSKGVVGIGQWQVHPWGLWFSLTDASGCVEYTFTAQLHLNPFGDAAKLLQGSVVRYPLLLSSGGFVSDPIQDEPMIRPPRKWFRPVVGRFSGLGKGLVDVQYSQRMTGLSQ
jgi:hypothetical protein